jgi:hypothetical protein
VNFHLKSGVRTVGIQVETAIALMQAQSIYEDFEIEGGLVVTSLTEGRHSRESFHYYGYAADLRTSPFFIGSGGVPDDVLPDLLHALREELEPSGWQVIYEATPPHIHIELSLNGEK